MKSKAWPLTLLIVFLVCDLTAQETQRAAVLKGRIIDPLHVAAIHNVGISIPELSMLTTADVSGMFAFTNVPFGIYHIVIRGGGVKTDSVKVLVKRDTVDVGTLRIVVNNDSYSSEMELPVMSIDDVEADEEGTTAPVVSGLLMSSRDPFLSTVAYGFAQYYFQPRGYGRNQQQVLINGVSINDIETGDAYYSQFSGLNDVFRNTSNTYGLQPAEAAYGGLNGTTSMDVTAASQPRQTRINYALTNRSYHNRLMLTHSSGISASGWAYTVSFSRRWAKEGYTEGTFFDSYSYYLGLSKKLTRGHSLHFTAFGAPIERGRSSLATREMYEITGTHYYNSFWGYQNGVKRNSKVAKTYQPYFIFSHEYKPSENTMWNTAVAYQLGNYSSSSIDWYNGRDPRPDYYRYLPSWSFEKYPNDPVFAAEQAELIGQHWKEDVDTRQIDWDRFYGVNRSNYEMLRDINGNMGDSLYGRRSVYVLASDVDESRKYIINTNVAHVFSPHLTLYSGLNFSRQRTVSYRRLDDLLGGDYFVNYNQFAERAYMGNPSVKQYDLNTPNRAIREGDKYRYNYNSTFTKLLWWGQGVYTLERIDLFAAASLGSTSFTREGLYRNGLFPSASFGKTAAEKFTVYGLKAGITYKINGRNYVFLNGAIGQEAPTMDNTYISARVFGKTVTDPKEQQFSSLEAGYLIRAPYLSARAVGYVTDVRSATLVQHYYSGELNSFINYVLKGVNTRSIGTELALEFKLSSSFTLKGVAAIGQAFYTSRPEATIYGDNDTLSSPVSRQVYVKDYYLGVGPQSAYSLSLSYRSKQFWYGALSFNYFDRNYIDIAPDRRTSEAVSGLEPGSQEWHQLLDQEEAPAAFAVDVFLGRSFLIAKTTKRSSRNTLLYFNAGVNNLLDNKDIIVQGTEQLRYEDGKPGMFPAKYSYGMGRNYFISLTLKY
jgi:hypothetical protein